MFKLNTDCSDASDYEQTYPGDCKALLITKKHIVLAKTDLYIDRSYVRPKKVTLKI